MLRIIMIAVLAVALASTAHAQNNAPTTNAASNTGSATATASANQKDASRAPKRGKSTADARPAYNINEGPNKVGAFAGGEQKLRARRD